MNGTHGEEETGGGSGIGLVTLTGLAAGVPSAVGVLLLLFFFLFCYIIKKPKAAKQAEQSLGYPLNPVHTPPP